MNSDNVANGAAPTAQGRRSIDFGIEHDGIIDWGEIRALLGVRHSAHSAGPVRFPLVEAGAVTFVWQGEAECLRLRHFMAGQSESPAFERETGGNLWRLRLQTPYDARFEYKFDVDGSWINDPLNSARASDPFGANSVCETHGYHMPEWARTNAAAAAGRIEHVVVASDAFSGERRLGVYLPAGYDQGGGYPLVVIHDGFDYVEYAALPAVLDNLIGCGDLPPLVAALTQSPDRMIEYVDDPRHVKFVTDDLLPALETNFRVAAEPARRVLMGASLGAVASLSVAARAPRVFGGVVLKSGSFIFDRNLLETRAELFARVSEFVGGLSKDERLSHRAFVTCGRYEGLVGENRRMAAFLRRAGVATRYVESRDSHHWHNWRDQIRAGLMWCLPRPRLLRVRGQRN